MSAEDAQVSQELANRDLADIKSLRESEAFGRYFLRRLRDKRGRLDEAFHKDSMSHEEREIHRRLILEYDELITMLDRDETACSRVLDQ